jgi:hypothetical protein
VAVTVTPWTGAEPLKYEMVPERVEVAIVGGITIGALLKGSVYTLT